MCKELTTLLLRKEFFDVSGGCGVDTSYGKSQCMDKDGIWFRYCPFCGKKIVSMSRPSGWTWNEESNH